MHREAMNAMNSMLVKARISGKYISVLDVGSQDVNGSYRDIINDRGWDYLGLDIQKGENVDVVAETPYHYPFIDNSFHVVISGSTMEHVEMPWLWLPELVRVLKPHGLLCIVTHWAYPVHRYPVDCWRVLPDGMKALFDYTKNLESYDIKIINHHDITASAYKKGTL